MCSAIGHSLPGLFGTVILAFLLSSSQTAFSQTTKGEETLQGRVADSAGAALLGASVTLSNLSTGLERVAIADANGSFVFKVVRDGRYRFTDCRDPNVGKLANGAPLPIYRTELGRTFRVGMRFTWASERK